jgi:hypothetical protein
MSLEFTAELILNELDDHHTDCCHDQDVEQGHDHHEAEGLIHNLDHPTVGVQ